MWGRLAFCEGEEDGEGLLGYLARRLRAPHPSPLAFSNGRSEKYWSRFI